MKFIFNLILLGVLVIGGAYVYATVSGDDDFKRKLQYNMDHYSEMARKFYDDARDDTKNVQRDLKREANQVKRQIKNIEPPKIDLQ